jgi:alkylated DNA repair protein (DNA oxidative demethylase)
LQASTGAAAKIASFVERPVTIGMFDLFDAPAVPGLATRSDMFTSAEEATLIAAIDLESLSPFRFQRWTGKRLTRSFGWSYDFEDGSIAQVDPIPDWLQSAKSRAAAFAGLAPDELVQALVIRYDAGAGIGWHKDRTVFQHVVGISLGNAATLRLRQRTDTGFVRAKTELAPRSIYHLAGEVRHRWEHSIASMDVPRWSVTFRSLSNKGLVYDRR